MTGFENLAGSAYNDTLIGDANANIIQGGAGNDFLYGAGGLDSLIGGAGADTFIFKALTAMSAGAVTISDFVANDGDVIDISDILAGHYDPISQSINDFVQMQSVGVNTIIKVDLDGTGTAQGWSQIATVSNATLDLDIMMATKHLDVT
ncbi:MAG: type I secretion C-terminal target domain-containing protein [Alphaproteobacteria bacterium]|nr:type I secretion C-terminal target domain-containing protein [Alphaproteobacteria bacterium]